MCKCLRESLTFCTNVHLSEVTHYFNTLLIYRDSVWRWRVTKLNDEAHLMMCVLDNNSTLLLKQKIYISPIHSFLVSVLSHDVLTAVGVTNTAILILSNPCLSNLMLQIVLPAEWFPFYLCHALSASSFLPLFLPLSLSLLEELDCSCNELESLPPTIGYLHSLRTFAADENFLSELPREVWRWRHILKSLHFYVHYLKKKAFWNQMNLFDTACIMCTSAHGYFLNMADFSATNCVRWQWLTEVSVSLWSHFYSVIFSGFS